MTHRRQPPALKVVSEPADNVVGIEIGSYISFLILENFWSLVSLFSLRIVEIHGDIVIGREVFSFKSRFRFKQRLRKSFGLEERHVSIVQSCKQRLRSSYVIASRARQPTALGGLIRE